ncbi:MAG: hypothetical protein U5M51_01565 [Emticicia sp.]|nr:hypothetical protein [Emticicia sp.]
MKKEGLKDEHELQSYFIKRIDKFLTSKGKKNDWLGRNSGRWNFAKRNHYVVARN